MSVNQSTRAYATTINDRSGQNKAIFRAHKLADMILEDGALGILLKKILNIIISISDDI
jgi:hypothetical protein